LRLQAACGVLCLILLVAGFSRNLRQVNWKTILWGILLQIGLALLILKVEWTWDGSTYSVYEFFRRLGAAIQQFLDFTSAGARFVFGVLADRETLARVFGPGNSVVLAFGVLPTIIFASCVFSLLYYLRILQFFVTVLARTMMYAMRTSGAETLSSVANVFLGQTEAPLIVKPYISRMTRSELLALMVGGMATISGGIMAVYIQMGADPVAILVTSVMAAPCGLYLSKLLWPETEQPETLGKAKAPVEVPFSNAIDAITAGASDGMKLMINVMAMLIAFLALLAMVNYLLDYAYVSLFSEATRADWQIRYGIVKFDLTYIFSKVFAPLAFLIGITGDDVSRVADLLGIKLVGNEFLAYAKLTSEYHFETGAAPLSHRSFVLATFALTGFANFGSVGIQLGGIGALAEDRRKDLAQLGM
ncbi:MAG TPA: nucleoside transporter C-terminal domain-containing protein, partial [Gemmatales bacterium]|nr:nucleoside transporter C-terminal domain-containing protein [Gemmatales bacterium]